MRRQLKKEPLRRYHAKMICIFYKQSLDECNVTNSIFTDDLYRKSCDQDLLETSTLKVLILALSFYNVHNSTFDNHTQICIE